MPCVRGLGRLQKKRRKSNMDDTAHQLAPKMPPIANHGSMGATKPTPIPSNILTAGNATKNLGSGHQNHVNNDCGATALTGFLADLSDDRGTPKIPSSGLPET